MISEQEFKNKLIKTLNSIHEGWRNGDLDSFEGQKADIVNDVLKIAIEIKDDSFFKKITQEELKRKRFASRHTDLTQKNRQFKNHIKSANKKFINYPNYKTLLIIRTEMVDSGSESIDYTIDGPLAYRKGETGLVYSGRPSSFWLDHDKSTSEVGGVLFLDDNNYYYRTNENPNIDKRRILNKSKINKLFFNSF